MSSHQNFFIVGHRGAAGEAFENSMGGFRHALNLGIDAIELDIRAFEGELWVIHDHELERLTGQPGLFHELPRPDSIRLKNGEAVPKLREVLDLCWGKMPINIEIKSFDTAELLLELLEQYPAIESESNFPWILISSFDHRQLLSLRQQNSHWALAPVSYGIPMQPQVLIDALKPYSWHFDDEYLDYELIRHIQNQDIKVMVYTVNSVELANKLKDAGIDGIFTDFPSTFRTID